MRVNFEKVSLFVLMKNIIVVMMAALLVWGTAYAISVSTDGRESSMTSSRLEQLNNPEDIGNIRSENHIARHDSASLDSFIRHYMETAHIPGLATWCFKDGQVIWQQCYGYANLEDSIEVADTTIFSLASISKTITGTAIMQLWERGLLRLDDDINRFLPFQVVNPFYPDSIMTLRMLMTHTSSIHDNESILYPLWSIGDSPIPLDSFLHEYLVPGGMYYSTLNFNDSIPGTQYDYSGVAIGLLGYLVEAIEEVSFPVHCQDSIFDPLSMYETSWFLAGLDTNNLARPYQWTGGSYNRLPWWGCPWYPGNQLRTSSIQLARYLTAFMQYGIIDTVRILDSTSVVAITTPQYQWTPTNWVGLVWQYALLAGRWLWGHNGAGGGIDTFMGFCPAEGSAAIALTNCGSYGCSWTIASALLDYAERYGPVPSAPYIVEVRKNLSDIYLAWNQVTTDTSGNPDTIDHYVIYCDTNPNYIVSTADSIGYRDYPETTFVDANAMNDTNHYYYLVKAVNIHNKKSKPSNMGFKLNKFFNENPATTDKNWTSLPW